MKQADAILALRTENRNLLYKIAPMSFNEALKAVMEWVEITEEALTDKASLNLKMVQRMRARPDYPKSVESLVAICLAMRLPSKISSALFEKAGMKLRIVDHPAHVFYDFFLSKFPSFTLEYCNSLLIAKGLPPISNDPDDAEQ